MSHLLPQYQIEESEILRKAYQLLAYFFANAQIARIAHPHMPSHPLKELEARFLHKEISTLLLEVAILFRSLDDQLKNSANEDRRNDYLEKVRSTNERYGFDMFENIPLRECCNKVIHAISFMPLVVEGEGAHTQDFAAYYEGYDKEIVWHHLSGKIRIAGMYKNDEWAYLIDVPEFVEALFYLLGNSQQSTNND